MLGKQKAVSKDRAAAEVAGYYAGVSVLGDGLKKNSRNNPQAIGIVTKNPPQHINITGDFNRGGEGESQTTASKYLILLQFVFSKLLIFCLETSPIRNYSRRYARLYKLYFSARQEHLSSPDFLTAYNAYIGSR